jgi:hypothetical protein
MRISTEAEMYNEGGIRREEFDVAQVSAQRTASVGDISLSDRCIGHALGDKHQITYYLPI